MCRKQKTSKEDLLEEVEMESQGNLEVLNISSASLSSQNDIQDSDTRLLEEVLSPSNLTKACKKVKSNKGSPGVDGMKVDELLPYFQQHGELIRSSILNGNFKPSPVRRHEIDKPDGGTRLLGIPTVIDRTIQQAIAQVISPMFEKVFSNNSYGFRPGKSAAQAVLTAKEYINQGYSWVVDIDLETFFDRVNHDILMYLLSTKISDKRLLKLIRKYLESGIMINGLEIITEEGTPQGGPLSPLLSNVVLHELDMLLESRGHKFCRFADDCNVYVKSKRAGERVMQSLTSFIEKKLKLKINKNKSAVARPWKRKFLGFSFYRFNGEIKIRVHPKSIKKFKFKLKSITSGNSGQSLKSILTELKQAIRGWVNYFGIANMKMLAKRLDEWVRRRLRMCIWKQWKKIKTRFKNLVKLGFNDNLAHRYSNTRKGAWRTSRSHILNSTLTNEYFENLGYFSILNHYIVIFQTL